MNRLIEILAASTKLGLTSFGGPTAHLGYFHEEYIQRRRWLDEKSYADIVALCQFLPGPASSQVGIALGMIRGGMLGGIFAWLGFTLPSIIALTIFSAVALDFTMSGSGWIHGLKIVAVAVVAHAVLSMGKTLAPDRTRATIAILAASVSLLWNSALTQIIIIILSAFIGYLLFKKQDSTEFEPFRITISRRTGFISFVVFIILLLILPLAAYYSSSLALAVFDSFYRVGSLVFGGGHVVLPLLEREVVGTGLMSSELFIAGYGAAQAVPGPLFTFASYLGGVIGGWEWSILTTIAIFLPSFLLVTAILPFWDTIRRISWVRSSLVGVNAAVVGILLAVLYDPLWTSSIRSILDFCFALVAFGLLSFWKIPAWIVVLLGIVGGIIIY